MSISLQDLNNIVKLKLRGRKSTLVPQICGQLIMEIAQKYVENPEIRNDVNSYAQSEIGKKRVNQINKNEDKNKKDRDQIAKEKKQMLTNPLSIPDIKETRMYKKTGGVKRRNNLELKHAWLKSEEANKYINKCKDKNGIFGFNVYRGDKDHLTDKIMFRCKDKNGKIIKDDKGRYIKSKYTEPKKKSDNKKKKQSKPQPKIVKCHYEYQTDGTYAYVEDGYDAKANDCKRYKRIYEIQQQRLEEKKKNF